MGVKESSASVRLIASTLAAHFVSASNARSAHQNG